MLGVEAVESGGGVGWQISMAGGPVYTCTIGIFGGVVFFSVPNERFSKNEKCGCICNSFLDTTLFCVEITIHQKDSPALYLSGNC